LLPRRRESYVAIHGGYLCHIKKTHCRGAALSGRIPVKHVSSHAFGGIAS